MTRIEADHISELGNIKMKVVAKPSATSTLTPSSPVGATYTAVVTSPAVTSSTGVSSIDASLTLVMAPPTTAPVRLPLQMESQYYG